MPGWRSIGTALLAAGACLTAGAAAAQEGAERRPGVPSRPLPDGLLYVLTDADDGALLRIEPVTGAAPGSGGG